MNRFEITNKTPLDITKLFTFDYWTGHTNALAPVVDSFSLHYWLYITVFASIVIFAFGFRYYKGFFLDKKTVERLAKGEETQNPIFDKLTFFENYFLVGTYLGAFFFLARQVNLALLSNRLFFLALIFYFIYCIYRVIKYFLKEKKLEEYYYNLNKKS